MTIEYKHSGSVQRFHLAHGAGQAAKVAVVRSWSRCGRCCLRLNAGVANTHANLKTASATTYNLCTSLKPTWSHHESCAEVHLALGSQLGGCEPEFTYSSGASASKCQVHLLYDEQDEPQLPDFLLLQAAEPLFGETEKAYMIRKWNQARQLICCF